MAEIPIGVGLDELIHPGGYAPLQVQLRKGRSQLREIHPVVAQVGSGRGGERNVSNRGRPPGPSRQCRGPERCPRSARR